jgi:hypothetical protein
VSARRFDATAAEVRRALDGVYEGLPADGALWRCIAGPYRTPVELGLEDGPVVVVRATVVPAPELTGAIARAILFEHDSLMFGRFVHADGAIRIEQGIVGGHTMDDQEVRLAVWGVGWAAGAYRERWQTHLAGGAVLGGDPIAGVAARRGAEERVASTQTRVERFLREHYGSFTFDEAWGYHGAFGSTRVFVSVRHVLETTTVVLIASPVLTQVTLTDALALDAAAITAARPFGRFAFSADRGELWAEHSIVGDDLDPEELTTAIDAVAELADGEDEQLQAAYGGLRYADLTGAG